MRRALLLALLAGMLAGCSGEKSSSYQGYVEGEYVYVASALGGRLERLFVQRGQSVEA
jgi:HlyD family secretion protein